MKNLFRIFLFCLLPVLSLASSERDFLDSMQTALENADNDTIRLDINRKLGFYYQDSEAEIGLRYHLRQLALAKKLNLKLWEADAYQQVAYCHRWLDNLPASYESYMRGLKIAEDPASSKIGWGYAQFSFSKSPEDARKSIIGMIHYELADLYERSRESDKVAFHLNEALRIGKKLQNKKILSLSTRDIGEMYFRRNLPDSALMYYRKALEHYHNSPYKIQDGIVHQLISAVYMQKQNYDSALFHIKRSVELASRDYKLASLSVSFVMSGHVFEEMGQLDSANVYTHKGIELADSINNKALLAMGNVQLGSIYKSQGKNLLAYQHLLDGKTLSDSINNAYIDRLLVFQNLGFDQKIRLQELEKENELNRKKAQMYALMGGLGIFLVLALLLYRNNRQKHKRNDVLKATLSDLKTTQVQLVQSEKMASLGELTAGIAHEIQNPLNFVNNFSELNSELLSELKEELANGNVTEVEAIANDLSENEAKITHHGKRADAIVKGMLAHSRSGKGEKVPTDINALADEYLKLSYHGLRAKDKSFNADFKTEFDPNLPKINVVPQDIGRVLLNLINNAFQACAERPPAGRAGSRSAVRERSKNEASDYKPLVTLRTELTASGQQLIAISDNGPGIPPDIKDKIFQPFFTTKPTGQGTGLGLSLSYDIVKAHGGELTVESGNGVRGCTFLITLPK